MSGAADVGRSDALHDLRRLITAMGPYVDHVVLVGGWAAWAYARAWAPEATQTLLTYDVDIALPSSLRLPGESLDALLIQGGFVRRYVDPSAGSSATRYQPARFGDDIAPIYAEFLTHYAGPEGSPGLAQIAGVTAQRLRYMDLALIEPLAIAAADLPELGLPSHVSVRVPHPMNYIVHKLLTLGLREHRRRRKDHAYLIQVLHDTRTRWPEMRARLAELSEDRRVHARWLGRAVAQFERSFIATDGAGADDAAAVLHDLRSAVTPGVARRIALRAGAELGLTRG